MKVDRRGRDRIGGYQLRSKLGQGGSGTVYEAVQLSLQRPVALKVLHPHLADDADFVARFEREGRLQARLDHPHVASIYEVGSDAGRLYIAMQLIRGTTLEGRLGTPGLTAAETVRLLRQVADALDAAHRDGLIHRDLKPRNILVSPQGQAFLTDFGMATARQGSALTVGRQVIGTLDYLAPEAVKGEPADERTDVYGLAATAYACLVGSPMFSDLPPAAHLHAVVEQPPPAPSSLCLGLPSNVDEVFAAGLAKDRDARPPSAGAFVSALEHALSSAMEPIESPIVPGRPVRRARTARWAAVGALAAVTGIAVSLLALSPSATGPPPALPGTELIGSALTGSTGKQLGCPAIIAFSGCSVQQVDLRGHPLTMPADGVIRAWTVRGTHGTVALELSRPTPLGFVQDIIGPPERVNDSGLHTFRTGLPVHLGDLIGVRLSPGATIEYSPAPGATARVWALELEQLALQSPAGYFGSRPSTIVAGQLSVRIDFQQAGDAAPRQLLGSAAAAAPAGQVLASRAVALPTGPILVAVVRLRSGLALDLLRGGQRFARAPLPFGDPLAQLANLNAEALPDPQTYAEVTISARVGSSYDTMQAHVSSRRVEAFF